MNTRIPKIGDIVEYELTDGDAEAINRRRTDSADSRELHKRVKSGVIVHTGNTAHGGKVEWVLETESTSAYLKTTSRGDKYPMMITRVWGDTPESQVNGQVFLDGNDTIWVTSVHCADEPRGFQFHAEPSALPARIA